MSDPIVKGFFEPTTSTISYLVSDPNGPAAMIVDSVLDFDTKSGRTSTRSAAAIAEAAAGMKVEWIVDTHPHADHLSAMQWLREKVGGKTAIGSGISQVQQTWAPIFDLDDSFRRDGSQFDHLLVDGETFAVGSLRVTVMNTPGHTPACVTLIVEGSSGRKHAFVGDLIFMPDSGTARADFPGGSARTLYRSLRKVLDLPGDTLVYTAHDYQPGGRPLAYVSTVAEQRERNTHVRDGVDEEAYVQVREARDKTLSAPALLLPSLQVNIRAGHLPPPAPNGTTYLRIPINRI